MNKLRLGLITGILAGFLDIAPMLAQKFPWEACASAFTLWVITGFLIAVTQINLHPVRKGILIAFLVLTPAGILIAAREPFSLLPIAAMTLILGSGLGYVIEKWGR
jgi:hypothetical protein